MHGNDTPKPSHSQAISLVDILAAMVTGIEIAGLVLAITPLCITAVEHHSETFRPITTLFRHHVQHRKRLRDLGVCLVRLEQTLMKILEASGIANGTSVTQFSDACASRLWIDKGEEARIIAHFGVKVYKLSFEVIMERIQEDLEEIQSILGLLNGDTSAGADDVSQYPGKCSAKRIRIN